MKAPSVYVVKKYVNAINKMKAKYVTSERLSKVVGVYPEVINETIAYFEPMINMDTSINLRDLLPAMNQYISDIEEKKQPLVHQEVITKKNIQEYESVNDFIYRKMSVGGIIDRGAYLSEKDLRILKKLVNDELAKRKNKK